MLKTLFAMMVVFFLFICGLRADNDNTQAYQFGVSQSLSIEKTGVKLRVLSDTAEGRFFPGSIKMRGDPLAVDSDYDVVRGIWKKAAHE